MKYYNLKYWVFSICLFYSCGFFSDKISKNEIDKTIELSMIPEIDSLDFEIRDIVMNNPHSNTTIRFNDSVDKLIQDAIEESDKQSQ